MKKNILLKGKKGKRNCVLIKDFNTFMYNDFTSWKKHFCCSKEILKRHFIDCFKTNGKQRIIMLKKVNTLNSKTVKEKLSHQL